MPDDNIMVYMINSELFHTFLNEYPAYRSFVVTRSLARRTYLFKVISENEQMFLIKKKEVEHKDVFYAHEKPEYFFASESDEDDELKKHKGMHDANGEMIEGEALRKKKS